MRPHARGTGVEREGHLRLLVGQCVGEAKALKPPSGLPAILELPNSPATQSCDTAPAATLLE